MLPTNTQAMVAEGQFTTLAFALDVAMANDDMARWDYFFTWGYMWEPLCKDAAGNPVVTESTTAKTVVR